jgi:hypothetical protein
MVQSKMSPGAFAHFMEILDGAEPHFSQETVDDLMLLVQEFGHNGLIASLLRNETFPGMRKMYATYYQNSTGISEAQQSKPISSRFATRLASCNSTYR